MPLGKHKAEESEKTQEAGLNGIRESGGTRTGGKNAGTTGSRRIGGACQIGSRRRDSDRGVGVRRSEDTSHAKDRKLNQKDY